MPDAAGAGQELREYEDLGFIYTVGRCAGNYRPFSEDALWCVAVVCTLRGPGLTLSEIRELTAAHLTRTGEPIGRRFAQVLQAVRGSRPRQMIQHYISVRSGWWILTIGMFDGSVAGFIVLRMRRTMTSSAFQFVLGLEALTVACGVASMLIKGYDILQMLVLFGLAETAVVLSTLGRVEIFFNALVDTDNWYSRHTTMVSLRFIGVALTLSVAALPLLVKIHLVGS